MTLRSAASGSGTAKSRKARPNHEALAFSTPNDSRKPEGKRRIRARVYRVNWSLGAQALQYSDAVPKKTEGTNIANAGHRANPLAGSCSLRSEYNSQAEMKGTRRMWDALSSWLAN